MFKFTIQMRFYAHKSISALSIAIPCAYWSAAECTDKPVRSYTVVVVGGGIVGTCIAHNLKQRYPKLAVDCKLSGKDTIENEAFTVAVIEKSVCGGGASGLSAGTLWSAGHGDKNTSSSNVSLQLCATSMDYYQTIQNSGYDCGLVRSGNLIIAMNKEEAVHLKNEHDRLRAHRYNSVYFGSPEAVATVEPLLQGGAACAALHTPESGYIDPMTTTAAIRAAAEDEGVSFFEHTGVERIERISKPQNMSTFVNNSKYRLTTSDGESFEAEHVVIAAGISCPPLLKPLGIEVPIYAVKGAMWESNAVPTKDIPLMRNTIYTAESELYWERLYSAPMSLPRSSMPEIPESPKYCTTDEHGSITTRHCYGRPCADGSVVFGGSRVFVPHPTDSSLIDNEDCVSRVFSHVCEFMPAMSVVGRSGGYWSGLMPFSFDGRPLVGHLRALSADFMGLWIAGGFGGDGMMMGPAAAQYISDEIIKSLLSDRSENRCSGDEKALCCYDASNMVTGVNYLSPLSSHFKDYESYCGAMHEYVDPTRRIGGSVQILPGGLVMR